MIWGGQGYGRKNELTIYNRSQSKKFPGPNHGGNVKVTERNEPPNHISEHPAGYSPWRTYRHSRPKATYVSNQYQLKKKKALVWYKGFFKYRTFWVNLNDL